MRQLFPRDSRWLSSVLRAGPRVVDTAECVLAVLMAIALAHMLGARNVSWAAFSAYMVMRGRVADTLLRGALRMLGTAVGAGLALALVPLVHWPWPGASVVGASLLCALIGEGALVGALASRFSYAWVLAGLTFEMVLLDKLAHPALALASFAATRLLEVGSGIGASIAVSTLTALTVRRRWPGTAPAVPQPAGLRQALRHAAQGAVALALLPLLGRLAAMPDLPQAAVSIMAVMLIPATHLQAAGLSPVHRKFLLRIAGCLAGAAAASPFLLFAHASATVLIVGTVAGVAVGRSIENSWGAFAYAGTQFTLAVLVALVPDSYANATVGPALARLAGILLGVALLEPVLIAWHLVEKVALRKQPSPGIETVSSGE